MLVDLLIDMVAGVLTWFTTLLPVWTWSADLEWMGPSFAWMRQLDYLFGLGFVVLALLSTYALEGSIVALKWIISGIRLLRGAG
jgi:hypothetical protein